MGERILSEATFIKIPPTARSSPNPKKGKGNERANEGKKAKGKKDKHTHIHTHIHTHTHTHTRLLNKHTLLCTGCSLSVFTKQIDEQTNETNRHTKEVNKHAGAGLAHFAVSHASVSRQLESGSSSFSARSGQ